jgi:hypothetical protein
MDTFLDQRRYSVIENDKPCKMKFPKYYNARKVEVILNPGDALYIPAGWFHFVFSEDVSDNGLNLAINTWTITNKDELDIFNKQDYTLEVATHSNVVVNSTQPYKLCLDKCMHEWNNKVLNIDYLLNHMHDVELTTSTTPLFPPAFLEKYASCVTHTECIPFKEAYRRRNEGHCYIVQHPLAKEIDIMLPTTFKPSRPDSINIWLNFGKVHTMLHYDMDDNIYYQLYGTKRVVLYPPSERDNLYMFNDAPLHLLDGLKKRRVMTDTDPLVQVFSSALQADVCNALVLHLNTKKENMCVLMNDHMLDECLLNCLRQHVATYLNILDADGETCMVPCKFMGDSGYTLQKYCHMRRADNEICDVWTNDLHICTQGDVPKISVAKFVWFLNDVEHGGTLRVRGCTITPKQGSLVIFPCGVGYNYCQSKPLSNDMYICSGYLLCSF